MVRPPTQKKYLVLRYDLNLTPLRNPMKIYFLKKDENYACES